MPPRKSKSNVIVWVIVGGVLGCCVLPIVLVGGGGFWLFNKAKGFAGCAISYSQVQQGLLNYAQAHNGKLPKAETWQDDVREDYRKLMKSKKEMGPIDQMPAEGDWGCKDSEGVMSGMAFNTDLSGKKLDDIKDRYSVVLLFETEHPGKNLHEKFKERDFFTSPKILGKNRGWMQIGLSGQPTMVGRGGQRVPVNVNTSAGGNPFDVQVKPSSGDGDSSK